MTWGTFSVPHQGAGAISASGNECDIIQDGGRKRKLRLRLDRAPKSSLYYLYVSCEDDAGVALLKKLKTTKIQKVISEALKSLGRLM